MKRILLGLISALIVSFGSLWLLLFTSTGNGIIKPWLESYLQGYASQAKEQALAEKGLNPRVLHKKAKGKPLSKQLQKRNATIAKTRSRVEHVFAGIEQMGGKCIRVIGQQRANFVMTIMATVYNLKRFVFLQRSGGHL